MYCLFTKITYILSFPLVPLWSSLSELSEVLSPGLWSSFCPKQNSTRSSHIVHLFNQWIEPELACTGSLES